MIKFEASFLTHASQEVIFIFKNERLAAINIAKTGPHFPYLSKMCFQSKQWVSPTTNFQLYFCLPPDDAVSVSVLLPVSIRLSWPLNLFVVTQGPEQAVLLYINVFAKYKRLFGTSITFSF